MIDTSDSNHLYTNFKFNVISGEADVYISRAFSFPDESNSINSIHLKATAGIYSSNVQYMSVKHNSA